MRIGSYTGYFDSIAGGRDPVFMANNSDMAQMDEVAYAMPSPSSLTKIHQTKWYFKALRYHNFFGAYKEPSGVHAPWDYQTAHPECFLLDDTGNRFNYQQCFDGTPDRWAVDPGNVALQDWTAQYLASVMPEGWDGVMGDNSFVGGLHAWGRMSEGGHVINPRTKQPWTGQEISAAMTQWVNKVKAAIGNKLLCCNGIWHGDIFSTTSGYVHQGYVDMCNNTTCDYVMSESWMSDGSVPKNMALLETISKGGKLIVITGDYSGSILANAARAIYFDGNCYGGGGINVGTPKGPRIVNGSVITRDFWGGGLASVDLNTGAASLTPGKGCDWGYHWDESAQACVADVIPVQGRKLTISAEPGGTTSPVAGIYTFP